MRLYFIRHGQSENNALYSSIGSDRGRVDDPKLTDIGRRQAEATAAYLAHSGDPVDMGKNGSGFHFTHLYCSLMQRSLSTGTIIANALQMPLAGWQDWHETGGIYLRNSETGEFTVRPGISRAELAREFPGVQAEPAMGEDGWWNRPVESESDWPVRARRVLHELLERHGEAEDRVAVVSHGGFFMQFLAAVMGLEKIQPVWFRLYNCAITRFDFQADEPVVVYHNYTSHLAGGLIT